MASPRSSVSNLSDPLLSKSKTGVCSLNIEREEKAPFSKGDGIDAASATPLTHISHLNGLRALAFIGVLVFHFRLGWQGGFLGVDVFFVLSGYLMTRSINPQIARGDFSYVSFLRRRFWRLYPALLCTILATLSAAFAFLSPYLVSQIALSAEASTLSWSNVLFMGEDGYFGTSSALKPLLHTWSLSLEWQFYLFWPAFLLALHHSVAYVDAMWPLALLCFLSFTYGITIASTMPQAAFFILPGRAFEFGLGALLLISPPVSSERIGNMMSVSGTVLILVSFIYLDSSYGSPAVIALPVLCGAMLVISTPSEAEANTIYNFAPLEYLGRISYSAYLVHWPVFVFYHNIYEHDVAPWFVEVVVIAVMLAVSAAMYHFVEDEFRRANKRWHKPIGFSLIVLVLAVSWHAQVTNGWEMRAPASARTDKRHIMQDARDIYKPRSKVFWPTGSLSEPDYGIIPSNSGKSVEDGDKFDALIVGDSFAEPLAGVMASLASELNKDYILLSHAACLPAFDETSLNPQIEDYFNPGQNERADLCKKVLRPNMLKLIRTANTEVVVLAGNWVGGHHIWEADSNTVRESSTKTSHSKRSRFENSILKLRNMYKKVVLVGATPCAHFHVRECLAAAGPLSGLKTCPNITRVAAPFMGTESEQKRQKSRVEARNHLKKMMKAPLFTEGLREGWLSYVDPFNTFCKHRKGECVVSIDGVSLYSDTEHLTANATIHMKGAIRQALGRLAKAEHAATIEDQFAENEHAVTIEDQLTETEHPAVTEDEVTEAEYAAILDDLLTETEYPTMIEDQSTS